MFRKPIILTAPRKGSKWHHNFSNGKKNLILMYMAENVDTSSYSLKGD